MTLGLAHLLNFGELQMYCESVIQIHVQIKQNVELALAPQFILHLHSVKIGGFKLDRNCRSPLPTQYTDMRFKAKTLLL